MAKVALFTQSLGPEFLSFAKALQCQRHEVMVITSKNIVPPPQFPYQTLTYFQRWSLLEALRLFPRLLSHAPLIWHFVFSDLRQEKMSPAYGLLAQLARAIPGRVIATSLFATPTEAKRRQLRSLLKACDIVTTGSRESLMYLKRQKLLSDFCQTEVLPPLQSLDEEALTNKGEEHDEDMEKLALSAKPYLVVPNSDFHRDGIHWSELSAKISLVFLADRPTLSFGQTLPPSNVYFAGSHLPPADVAYLLSESSGLFTAFADLSEIELMRFHELCSLSRTPTLATPRQAEALPGFCVAKRNGWILEKGVQSFRQLALDNPDLRLNQPQYERRTYELADSALNELNRLYAKVHHAKTSGRIDSSLRPADH
jgi:hypothetical protein